MQEIEEARLTKILPLIQGQPGAPSYPELQCDSILNTYVDEFMYVHKICMQQFIDGLKHHCIE